MEQNYAQLVKGCRRHNPKAERALYECVAPMAMGVCMRYADDRDTAQDLMQEGFIKVFEHIGRLRDPRFLLSWVHRVMVNCCIDYCRRNRRVELLGFADEKVEVGVFDDLPFGMDDIVLAMQRLPNYQRLAYNLVEVEQWPYPDVAAKLDLEESTVRAYVCQAKASLRKILKDQLDKNQ